MNKTVFEKGMEKGMEKGIEEGQRRLMKTVLEEQFGPLPTSAIERLEKWPLAQIEYLAKSLAKAQDLKELGLED